MTLMMMMMIVICHLMFIIRLVLWRPNATLMPLAHAGPDSPDSPDIPDSAQWKCRAEITFDRFAFRRFIVCTCVYVAVV